MNKRLLVSAVLILFFQVLLSSQEKKLQEVLAIPQEVVQLKNLWNLYYSSGETTALEQYAERFVKFVNNKTYTIEMQPYVVSEVLFYTMFARSYCKNYSQSMDTAVTVFTNKLALEDVNPQSLYALRLFSFLAQKTKSYINVNETPVFDFKDDDTLNTVGQIVSKDSILLKLYESYSAVDGLYQRFEKYRLTNQTSSAFLLSEEAFYRILNNPSYVYLILFDQRYASLLDSFTRSCASYLNIQEKDLRTIFYNIPKQNLSVFPEDMYNQVYTKISNKRTDSFAAQVYAVSDLLYELHRNSMVYGFPVDIFFNSSGFQSILLVSEDPFYLNCLDESQIYSLCESLVFSSAAPYYVERVNSLVSALPAKGGV